MKKMEKKLERILKVKKLENPTKNLEFNKIKIKTNKLVKMNELALKVQNLHQMRIFTIKNQ